MTQGRFSKSRSFPALGALLLLAVAALAAEEPTPAALAGLNAAIGKVETQLDAQHQSANHFLAPVDATRLRHGELVIEQLTPQNGAELPGALLHDWRGTAFVPGAAPEDFERLMRDFEDYPRIYSPEVLRSRVLAAQGNHYQVTMRVVQQHILTVVMDTTYDVTFGRLDERHGYSVSHSTRIAEIESPGTAREHVLSGSEEHGFLWRLNTYWSYEQRDGGLYIQIESVSLTRSIPTGLGWAIGPFIESVPRQSLEFTLRATKNALKK